MSGNQFPIIGVMDSIRQKGTNDLSKTDIFSLNCLPIDEALKQPWQTDAHFVCYRIQGTSDADWPRMHKVVLPQVRAFDADIVSTVFAVDYDNPDHQPWNPAYLKEFWKKLELACDDDFLYPIEYTWLYFTRHGARIIWVLEDPIPVDEAEQHHRWLCQELIRRGLTGIDLTCSDWTRVFRLPYVMRGETPTWEEDYSEVFKAQLNNRMNARDLGKAGRVSSAAYALIEEYEGEQPEPDQVLPLLKQEGKHGPKWSDFRNASKRKLKNRECYPCMFDNEPIAQEGGRDSTIHAYVGQATGLLANVEGASPEAIYALFYSAVEQLSPDEDTPDWLNVLWSACVRNWEKDIAKIRAGEISEAAAAENEEQLMDLIKAGMMEWDDSPDLHSENAETWWPYVKERLLLCNEGGRYFIMKPDGTYDSESQDSNTLIMRLRRFGMTMVIQTIKVTDNGMSYKTAKDLGNEYGQMISSVVLRPQIEGGYLEHPQAESLELTINSYRRNPNLIPEFNRDVADWLLELPAEETDYPRLIDWISHAAAFDDGLICALSLVGPAGCGKKLLFRGMVEMLENETWADADELVGDWQYQLARSPFLLVNEGWPRPGKGKHPADRFREIITADQITINKKFAAPARAYNPVRAVLTANNLDVVKLLASGKELDPEDREALSVRLLHINLSKKASLWLKARGGMAFTAKPGQRWIKGDDGAPSDYVLAKHFLYLYENRERRSGRMLVEGNNSEELMFELRMESGRTPLVVETIINMVENSWAKGLAIHEGELYVLSGAIREYWNEKLKRGSSEQLTTKAVGQILKNIIKEPPQAIVLPTAKEYNRVRWHKLDVRYLIDVAQRVGFSCGYKTLNALVTEQKNRELGREIKEPVRIKMSRFGGRLTNLN